MTFMHKLSYRLALLKDRLPIAMVMLLAMATVFACERPVAVTGPGGGTISHLVISPKTLTLHPNATADFTAVAFLDTGDSASVTVSWSVTSGTMVRGDHDRLRRQRTDGSERQLGKRQQRGGERRRERTRYGDGRGRGHDHGHE